jgi:hypothetical protein
MSTNISTVICIRGRRVTGMEPLLADHPHQPRADGCRLPALVIGEPPE